MAQRARVLILSSLSLFGEGIEGLLRQEPRLEIIAVEAQPLEAGAIVHEYHPDVVVLADGEAVSGVGLELVRLVREGFCLRMVDVDLATNTLCAYRGKQQWIREPRDLVGAVLQLCEADDPFSPGAVSPYFDGPVA
jgi:DNA-binding NarL/FixJ family response regulator